MWTASNGDGPKDVARKFAARGSDTCYTCGATKDKDGDCPRGCSGDPGADEDKFAEGGSSDGRRDARQRVLTGLTVGQLKDILERVTGKRPSSDDRSTLIAKILKAEGY